ncbi:calcium-binding protein P-like [Macrosteles quadrilineatus]|uniref:calcium-binding protein P-like n=1 Tax=Macrosteles quadrilineatus TaxID=74068 RepID=UPI0023E30BB1|nr:calcium-binding protein P-like [Macrosteles quadrilineatus]
MFASSPKFEQPLLEVRDRRPLSPLGAGEDEDLRSVITPASQHQPGCGPRRKSAEVGENCRRRRNSPSSRAILGKSFDQKLKDMKSIKFSLLLLLFSSVVSIENKAASDNVGEFLGQLTSLLNQGIQQGVVPYQSGGGGYPPPRPYPPPPGTPYPPGQPYPPGPGSPGPYPPGPYPPGPYGQYPPGYPGQGLVPGPTSILGALSSIARYDDLRCVPRLLCEVASGARPGSYGYPSYTQESPVPFLSKDALVTLLTVLNFVDDSPLLVFGRAALLGYTSRGDSRACLVAYPTCPRDPDHLVDYLNNHNGGFFRFFNQQLQQYAPQYQQYYPQGPPPYPGQGVPPPYPPQGAYPPQGPYPLQRPYPPQRPPPPYAQGAFPPQRPSSQYPQRPLRPYPSYPSPGLPQQYSSQHQKYQSRIQNKPENILEYNYYTSNPVDEDANRQAFAAFQNQDSGKNKSKLVFPDQGAQSTRLQSTRTGKTLLFPVDDSRDQLVSNRLPAERPISMIFPDRTGTGDLRLDVDEFGNYKTVYYESLQHFDNSNRGSRQVAFPSKTMQFPKKTMQFPTQ